MHIKTHLLAIAALNILLASVCNAADKPNILWLFQEDTSPWIGCYGDPINEDWTPNIDAMANRGVRFSRAFVPFPVCSACRSSIAVGANAIRFGAHEHRSRRGPQKTYLPEGLKTIAELMREANYFTFNVGKTDYNFAEAGDGIYSPISKANVKTPWRDCPDGQAFFGQIQLKGGKSNTTKFPQAKKTDPAAVTVPADYPQNELYREVVAQHYDTIRSEDEVIGGILERLKADGMLQSTIVVYFSDHGANNLVRHKQMPTEGGLHVPFIIQGPEPWVPQRGIVRDDLVNMIDLTATSLAWAGIDLPSWLEGRDLFANDFQSRTFVAGAKDRLDHTIDRVRTIRTDRYRYTRNYFLDRVFLQPQYRDSKPYLKSLRAAYADGTLAPKLAEIYFGERPAEELYDVIEDPAQVNNLVNDPSLADVLKEHRGILDKWLALGDLGAGNEPDEELRRNGENTKWGIGVNAEYERIRSDSDGDGLSDTWEEQNDRDPQDGKLLFAFDCGGWQTEGWKSNGDVTNIAGDQGFLNFELLASKASLLRHGLNLDTAKNQGAMQIRMRCKDDTSLFVSANGKSLGSIDVTASDSFTEYRLPLAGDTWKGVINNLKIDLVGKKGTTVTIDWIRTVE
ncbi:Arylsulfatase [Planctomycetes bacterium CA13]|uniref:Arylsulfatase n=1 Tax=Novipirellula herctigrandis TaxID=2527986 RepID=A0A5C5Z5M1_9BACT|nr:Arylsulfatase [Planctomycetes bacterium CA13]